MDPGPGSPPNPEPPSEEESLPFRRQGWFRAGALVPYTIRGRLDACGKQPRTVLGDTIVRNDKRADSPASIEGQGTDARRWTFSRRRLLATSGAIAAASATLQAVGSSHAFGANANPSITDENALPGSDPEEWESWNSESIQGYTTKFSYFPGDTVQFKVKTDSPNWRIRIYRMGWYGGKGARRLADITPSVQLPQTQPDQPFTDPGTLLKDYGNWAVSATWAIPATAVSGVYYALLERQDNSDSNQVIFVVKRSGPSDILVQTSDMTWQAYNMFGGNSLYFSEPTADQSRAYKVSYNRPIFGGGIENMFLASEVPLVRFLERNGYDVSYCGGIDVHEDGSLLLNRKIFISSGHDEYVSADERAHVTSARDAGVHLIFMSGNEYFWRVRFEPSIDGSNTANRTMVCYKGTLDDTKLDPTSQWTGTWADPRFTPPAIGGGQPQNQLTGQFFRVILPVDQFDDTMTVPHDYAPLRFWRNTSVAKLTTGQVHNLAPSCLGYEFDCDEDNGFRPPGSIRLSSTTVTVPQLLRDYGKTYSPGTATHNMTVYRAASGALVWGTGTVQWSYGLDEYHQADQGTATDPAMQQATVNMLADMGVQPSTLMSGLASASASADATPPMVSITEPADGSSFPLGATVTVSGTASDVGGVVAGVEISLDSGLSWRPLTGKQAWSSVLTLLKGGPNQIQVRAVDDSSNVGTPASITMNAGPRQLPCSIWPDSFLPTVPSTDDTHSVEAGVKFRAVEAGFITGLRFYKGPANTGTHVGHLWTSSGTSLVTATFINETATGWQSVEFAAVPIAANTTYIASVYMPAGGYAADAGYFSKAFALDPLIALADGDDGPNGVYRYGSSGFPQQSFGATNYWVDVVFTTHDATPPTLVDSSPAPGVNSVALGGPLTMTFGSTVTSSSIDLELRSSGGALVAGSTSWDAGSLTATFTPLADLSPLTTYEFTLLAAVNSDDVPLTEPITVPFTTIAGKGSYPASIWDSATTPATIDSGDTSSVELGMRFTSDSDGTITALRFYKAAGSAGDHIGHLWSAAGELLATAAFGNTTRSGWQQASLSAPVPITADSVYTVSYHCPNGVYGATAGAFLTGSIDRGVLHALPNSNGGNGVYQYGTSSFPTTTSGGVNYLADILFVAAPDTKPPTVTSVFPAKDLIAVAVSAAPSAVFSEPVNPTSVSFTIATKGGTAVPGSVAYDADNQQATFTPAQDLVAGTVYVATVSAADLAGNDLVQPQSWSFTTVNPAGATPVTIWTTSDVPDIPAADDDSGVEVGAWFVTAKSGAISGIRFYKGEANTGSHEGHVWSASGTLLGTAKFTQESASGWQQAMLDTPVEVSANTPFVVSYHAPNGRYATTNSGLASGASNGPLAISADSSRPNGVYRYGVAAFPTASYHAANYWVDAIFVDTRGPSVIETTPADGDPGVDPRPSITAVFDEAVQAGSIQFKLRDAGGGIVGGNVSYNATAQRATFSPTTALTPGSAYTASVEAALDIDNNPLTATASWSFTVEASGTQSIWPVSARPTTLLDVDPTAVELGVKFFSATSGQITGIRFYKGGPTAQGPHTISLWATSGARLATAVVSSESARGWQTALFAQPVPISAKVVYIASYFAPNGRASYDESYFTAGPTTNGDLTAVQHGASDGPNGVYAAASSSTFPAQDSRGTNYWVDVLFVAS